LLLEEQVLLCKSDYCYDIRSKKTKSKKKEQNLKEQVFSSFGGAATSHKLNGTVLIVTMNFRSAYIGFF
jgi:hypothetical protein